MTRDELFDMKRELERVIEENKLDILNLTTKTERLWSLKTKVENMIEEGGDDSDEV